MIIVIIEDATKIVKEYYTDYSKYVLSSRALSDVRDGLKFVQRRLVWRGFEFPNSMTKAVNLVGDVVKYHPHGSDSVFNSLVNITTFTNRLPLFKGKGNWGGFGTESAAPRYVSCKLAEHGRYNYQFLPYADFIEGELDREPSAIPCLIPYSMVGGSEGIGVGLSAKVIPLNLLDLIDYYIDTINNRKKKKVPKPDFGETIVSCEKSEAEKVIKSYEGSLTAVPVITQESDKVLVVNCLYKKNIENVLNSLSEYIDNDRVDFRNETVYKERYVFEIISKDVSIKELREKLEKACRIKVSFKRILTDGNGNAVYSTLDYSVRESLAYLNKALDKKFESDLKKLEFQKDVLEALKYLKNSSKFKDIPTMKTSEVKEFVKKKFSSDIADEVVRKPLSYLTKDHDGELKKIINEIKSIKKVDRKKYLIDLYTKYREIVLPLYNERQHTIYEEDISNKKMKVKLSSGTLLVSGSGADFDKIVYLVNDKGYLYIRAIDVLGESEINISDIPGKVVGFATDKDKYLLVQGSSGALAFDISELTVDKPLVKFKSKEKCIKANGVDKDIIKIKKKDYKIDKFLRTRASQFVNL